MEVIEGNIFIDGRVRKASIGIEDGKIVAVKKTLYGKTRSYRHMLILPSGLDIHVHFREPGMEYKEDFSTGSQAAAMAGVTFVMDMPNNVPPIINGEAFKRKLELIKGKAWVDYDIYAGVAKKLVEEARAYKLYLSHDNEIFLDYEHLPDLLKEIKKRNKILAVHAEDRGCIKRKGKNLKEYDMNSPVKCEVEAIKKLIEINEEINAKLHICHVTNEQAASIINSRASFGVTLHHILFSNTSKFVREAMGKVNPPLRSEEERKKLFNMVVRGKIPIMESDHAPHTIEEKESFEDAKAGIPGVDALLPYMLYMVKERILSLKTFVKMLSENPAKLMNINKGEIKEGRDADFIVVDLKKVKKIKPLSKCGWSVYEGMKAVYPYQVWMRGEMVVDDGELVGEARGRRA